MNRPLYIIFMILMAVAFIVGMYLSLEAGETVGKTLVRSIPIFLVMLIFYKLRKMDVENKEDQLKENSQGNNTDSTGGNE